MAAAAGDVVVDQRIARPTAGEEEVNAGPEGEGILFDPRDHLVYAWVDFYAPGATEGVVVRALVDSGSHDCELRASLIESAGLPAFGAGRLYETSAGRVIQSTFTAEVCVLGRWCEVTVAAIPEARFLPGDRAPCTDEASRSCGPRSADRLSCPHSREASATGGGCRTGSRRSGPGWATQTLSRARASAARRAQGWPCRCCKRAKGSRVTASTLVPALWCRF
eukprot:gnl/TRDRNA2_/TRDRNA2_36484_c0_seq1.p1 gnl/TRDRNA2_/TRDRNA2_36484_c0~~gnl/TRDRNA2_/TRDRNA2_36484_c0_seq1.p1  ORF type:complete len:222 (+),score=27.29 gnl/TRDRNA2_/TRDRNA2_36484_c0_seq1:84-749(+)